jgi:hypothetical protein
MSAPSVHGPLTVKPSPGSSDAAESLGAMAMDSDCSGSAGASVRPSREQPASTSNAVIVNATYRPDAERWWVVELAVIAYESTR